MRRKPGDDGEFRDEGNEDFGVQGRFGKMGKWDERRRKISERGRLGVPGVQHNEHYGHERHLFSIL